VTVKAREDHKTAVLKAAIKRTPAPVHVELFDCARQDPPLPDAIFVDDYWQSATYLLSAPDAEAWLDAKVGAGGVQLSLPELPKDCFYSIRVFACLVEMKVYRDDPWDPEFLQQIGATIYETFAWC
jgi:hypothetical protein